jgi:hypothetical protein
MGPPWPQSESEMVAKKGKNDWGLKVTPTKAAEAILVLQEYVKERMVLAESGKPAGSTPAIQMMAAVQDFCKELNDRIKAPAEALYNRIRFVLVPAIFEEEEKTKVSVDGIGSCRLQDDVSVKTLSPEGLVTWLTAEGLEDLIKETVNAQTLAAQIRARMKENADIVAKAMKSGVTSPEELQKLQKTLPPADIVEIKPLVRAQITRE